MLLPETKSSPFDGIEIELDASGELVVTGDKSTVPDSEEKPAEEVAKPAAETTANPYETRISGLESKIDQLTTALLTIAQGKQAPAKVEEPTLDQELEGITDTKGLVNVIKSNVQKLIEHNFASIREDMKQVKITNEFHQLNAKYGEDFVTRAQAIGDLMQEVPGLSMEKAYLALAKISPKQEKAKENPTPQTKPASELVERAKKLNLDSKESSNGQTIKETRQIKTIADAVNKAFEDLYQ